MDIPFLVSLAKENLIDAVHPGYGFLSESPELVRQMWENAGARVVGPGYEILEKTGDKLQAKELAKAHGVPVLPATQRPTDDLHEVRHFVAEIGFPVMIKAVDGGGGRGIRLVQHDAELRQAVDRATGESPSRKVFVEKAALNGFHHVEVQIIGDGTGEARHLWERDCSVQRRYQKIVECAPALIHDRLLISEVIRAALKMASAIRYCSLGTFEFLVNERTSEFFFLEINPRIQVEHTVTEQIASFDLVRAQLLLFEGLKLHDVGLASLADPAAVPNQVSIQMRLCAEDPSSKFALSMGKITSLHIPSGNGVRVDTHCSQTSPTIVGSDFDNLLAKIIVTDATWDGAIRRARRALRDTRVGGIKTNIELLQGIVESEAFGGREVDTQWLEAELSMLSEAGKESRSAFRPAIEVTSAVSSKALPVAAASNVLFRKGDAWSINLSTTGKDVSHQHIPHHLLLEKVIKNEFPQSIAAEIAYTASSSGGPSTTRYRIEATSTQSSAASVSSNHRRGDPNNRRHIVAPISGKLIEMLTCVGDEIEQNEVIAFVKQMKMELEIRSPRPGRVTWALELEDEAGEDIAEGVLLVELEILSPQHNGLSARGKL